jgi:hypothetical protein
MKPAGVARFIKGGDPNVYRTPFGKEAWSQRLAEEDIGIRLFDRNGTFLPLFPGTERNE